MSGPVPVLIAKVVQKTVPIQIRAIGRVEAFSTVDVKAQINGQVMQVHFRQGQDVKQGDLLFTIDPRPFEAALASGAGESRQGSRAIPAGRGRRASLRDPAQAERRLAPAIRSGRGYCRRALGLDAGRRSCGADRQIESRVHARFARRSTAAPATCWCMPATWSSPMPTPRWSSSTRCIRCTSTSRFPSRSCRTCASSWRSTSSRSRSRCPSSKGRVESGELSFVDNSVDAKTGTINLKGQFANDRQPAVAGRVRQYYTRDCSEHPGRDPGAVAGGADRAAGFVRFRRAARYEGHDQAGRDRRIDRQSDRRQPAGSSRAKRS